MYQIALVMSEFLLLGGDEDPTEIEFLQEEDDEEKGDKEPKVLGSVRS